MTAVLLIAGIAAVFYVWLRRPAESAPASPRMLIHESGVAAPMTATIPRIIWSYWHGDTRPLVVQRCLANWRMHSRGWEIRLIGPKDFDEFVIAADLPPTFRALTPARQSDWLRLYLLQRYGGVWIDASTILTRSLDWMVEAQAESRAQYLGFYLQRYTQQADAPIVDSWCVAAPPASSFVTDWYRELCTALALGDEIYLGQLEAEGRMAGLRQGIRNPSYLIIHMCGQVVLARGAGHRLQLWLAEDTAYHFQHHSHWRRLRMYRRLLLHPQPLRPPALVKLRGGERRKLEPYLQRGFYRRSSLVGVQLFGLSE